MMHWLRAFKWRIIFKNRLSTGIIPLYHKTFSKGFRWKKTLATVCSTLNLEPLKASDPLAKYIVMMHWLRAFE